MQKRTLHALILCCLSLSLFSQSAFERSVLLSGSLLENPDRIVLTWPKDATAQSYTVYRKALEATAWGAPIAMLGAMDTSYIDMDVERGIGYEYAFFKKGFDEVRDTICVPLNRELRFQISDMYGIGLCCSFGFGHYRIEACDSVYVEGSDFGWGESQVFTPCVTNDSCTNIYVSLLPDMFPNSTSWKLFDNQSGELIDSSGAVGDFIAERPRYGYIYAGFELPAIEHKGAVLVLVDSLWTDSLAMEIDRFKMDLIKEGWRAVYIQSISQNQSPPEIRSFIQSQYALIEDLQALFLIGHIPVPYSGNIYPDTHTEHRGAWASDTYYAELDGQWTDDSVDITSAQFDYNHNIPGDGKFDEDSIPTGLVELQLGRIDFHNMPAFATTEVELLRQYLDKNHRFRTGEIHLERRALIDDNFGQAFAAPAASGYRNFAPMFGADQIDTVDYFNTMRTESYLWSYGCGSGSHISSEGIGTTFDFAEDSLLTAFTMLFGSQFGDWDNENNFLRAPLASGLTLTNCWAGNPPWTFHQMAMGYTIGYCAQMTQNSQEGVYLNGPQLAHTALMGDPTLVMHPFGAVDSLWLSVSQDSQSVVLQWLALDDPDLLGYYLYRADSLNARFERIHTDLIVDTTYAHVEAIDGINVYMLRPVRLEHSASGSYLNPGTGIIDSVIFKRLIVSQQAPFHAATVSVHPNPSKGQYQLSWENRNSFKPIIELWDTYGRRIMHIEPSQNTNSYLMDCAALDNGLYFLSFRQGDQQKTFKLLLQ